jgi:hypothetical protein
MNMQQCWNDTDRVNRISWRETYSMATVPTKIPTRFGLVSNLGLCGDRPAINLFTHGTTNAKGVGG